MTELKTEAEVTEMLRAMLRKCAKRFREYQALHEARGTPEGAFQAIRNRDMANQCEAVLVLSGAAVLSSVRHG